MLYDVVCRKRGRETVVMTDELPKANAFVRQMRDSQRGLKVEYTVRPSGSTHKYKQKPNNHRGD